MERLHIYWIVPAVLAMLVVSGTLWNYREGQQEKVLRLQREAAVRTMVYEDLPVSEIELTDAPGVTATLQEVNTADQTVAISLDNTGDNSYARIPYLLLDAEAGGAWRRIPFIWGDYSISTNSLNYQLSAGETLAMTEEWGNLYGPLQPGHYRVYNRLENGEHLYFVGIEFDITE